MLRHFKCVLASHWENHEIKYTLLSFSISVVHIQKITLLTGIAGQQKPAILSEIGKRYVTGGWALGTVKLGFTLDLLTLSSYDLNFQQTKLIGSISGVLLVINKSLQTPTANK